MSQSPRNTGEPHVSTPNKSVGNLQNDAPVPESAGFAIKILAYIRIASGVACLVAPDFTCSLFGYPAPSEHGTLVRMVGARDIALGWLLASAGDKSAPDGGKTETRRAIWAGMAADAIEIGSLVYAVTIGHLGMTTAVAFGAGIINATVLGVWGLRGL